MTIAPSIAPRPPFSAAVELLKAAKLPTEDLTPSHCEHFFFAGPETAPSGIVGLEIYGDVALLRSLVVSPSHRGEGLGAALLRHAEMQASLRGVHAIYLLTTTADQFFAKQGYAAVSRDAAPGAIKSTREFSGICPASSAFMMRAI